MNLEERKKRIKRHNKKLDLLVDEMIDTIKSKLNGDSLNEPTKGTYKYFIATAICIFRHLSKKQGIHGYHKMKHVLSIKYLEIFQPGFDRMKIYEQCRLIEHHADAWIKGNVSSAIRLVEENGIPVYRVKPRKNIIRISVKWRDKKAKQGDKIREKAQLKRSVKAFLKNMKRHPEEDALALTHRTTRQIEYNGEEEN